MALVKTTPVRPAAAAELMAKARLVVRAFAAVWTVMRNRRAVGALDDLDDHLLADIGLTRADLREAYDTPLLVDPSLRLAAVVGRQRRSAPAARSHGRRGDAPRPAPDARRFG